MGTLARMAVRAKTKEATECRQCCAFCDKTIQPRGCIEADCPFLYTYEDEKSGRQYMGCLQKVFGVEIDVDMFHKAERTRAGYGGVKAMREPLPMCPFSVETSYEGRRPGVRLRQPALLRRGATASPAATARSTCATGSSAIVTMRSPRLRLARNRFAMSI